MCFRWKCLYASNGTFDTRHSVVMSTHPFSVLIYFGASNRYGLGQAGRSVLGQGCAIVTIEKGPYLTSTIVTLFGHDLAPITSNGGSRGGQRGPWPPPPPPKPKLYAPQKKRKEKKRKEKKRKEKKRKEKKKKRGKNRDKTKPHNFTPPPCAAKSCLYVQLLLKYANYNTLIGYMNVFIILLTIQHCHKICNGSLCS